MDKSKLVEEEELEKKEREISEKKMRSNNPRIFEELNDTNL